LKVFYFTKIDSAEEVMDCGIKLNQYFEREITVNEFKKRFLLTYLHPADSTKFYDDTYKAVKIKAPDDASYIAEGALYDEENMSLYESSLVPIREYRLGTYRKPECLIQCTLLPHQIEDFDRRRDEPILYDCSENLYLNRVLYKVREEFSFFDDLALERYYDVLVEEGKYIKEECNRFNVYINNDDNEIITIRKWRQLDVGEY
jgi:hypothetical protein